MKDSGILSNLRLVIQGWHRASLAVYLMCADIIVIR